jgi:hypothetical protein
MDGGGGGGGTPARGRGHGDALEGGGGGALRIRGGELLDTSSRKCVAPCVSFPFLCIRGGRRWRWSGRAAGADVPRAAGK